MKRFFLLFLLLPLFLTPGYSQAPANDSLIAMPKLEIPEITIVGKKAITLPFARKGEMYDVNLYPAPAPDTSLLGERLGTAMPVGAMPREEEKRTPLHASAEGTFGNFSTGNIHAFLDYSKGLWSFFGNGGYASTRGHTDNAKGSSFDLAANAQTLFSTDNDVLKTLRLSLGTTLLTEKYEVIFTPDIERSRQDFTLDASLNSLDRRGIAIDLAMKTNFWSVTDDSLSTERKITAVAPTLSSSLALNIGAVRWTTSLAFQNISLDYSMPTQSVTLFNIASSARWALSPGWYAAGGLLFAQGTDLSGADHVLALPTLAIDYLAGEHRQLSFWFAPELRINPYDNWIRQNPYLTRELILMPERLPVNTGIDFTIDDETFSLKTGIGYSGWTDKAIIAADTGKLRLEYVRAAQTRFTLDLGFQPAQQIRLSCSGFIQPTYEDGSSEQLPMTPLVKTETKVEYDLPKSITTWASINYRSEQNVDRSAARKLDGVALVNIGASTTMIPRIALSASINNLFGSSYYWWEGYKAPGVQILLNARVTLK